MPDSVVMTLERYFATPSLFRVHTDAWYAAPFAQRLGELYEARSDRTKAATYYRKVVDLWKDADPVLQPRVAEARRRLTRLSQASAPDRR